MHQLATIIKISNRHLIKWYIKQCFNNISKRNYCFKKPAVILGIESSCDETGIAVVDSTGKILGEAINSQLQFHLMEGGINPIVARKMHEDKIESVFRNCLNSANIELSDVDAIATTVEPGLPHSLIVGRDFGLNLSNKCNKPFIPIHHMQAHALTARLIEKVEFPFLALIISGKHCTLTLVESVNQFKLLGETKDNGLGNFLDKVARRLKLINILEYSNISGGKAIELAAMKAVDADQFKFPLPLSHYKDCNFSFSGLINSAKDHIESEEEKYNVLLDDLIPNVNNLCAGLILITVKHLCSKTEKAMQFLENKKLIPENNKILVISGGVASNNLIARGLEKLCLERGFKFIRTQPHLCTDNGIMIAWNGVEKYNANAGILRNRDEINKVDIKGKSLIGEDWRGVVLNEYLRKYRFKLKFNDLQ